MALQKIDWLRLSIVILVLVSFVMGRVLARTDLGGYTSSFYMPLLSSDIISILIYLEAILRNKRVRYRRIRLILRVGVFILAIWASSRLVQSCDYIVGDVRGWLYETLSCHNRDELSQWGLEDSSRIISAYRLLRALGIVCLTYAVLIFLETFAYWWSDEDTVATQDKKDAKQVSTPVDIELGVSSGQGLK